MTDPIRKAVFITSVDYESPIQVGDHQLARQFASNGWQVIFISKPITPWHLVARDNNSFKRRFSTCLSNGRWYTHGKGIICSFVPFAAVIPKNEIFLAKKWVFQYWHKTIFPNIKKNLAVKGFLDVDLLHIRDPLQGYLLDLINAKKKVFRVADNDSGFSSYNPFYTQAEHKIASKVDLVAYSAHQLENRVRQLQPKQAVFLPNGVDFEHFQKVKAIPELYRSCSRPLIVYAGSIDFWFDFDLINRLAIALPKFTFVIIGPNQNFGSRFVKVKNLILTGPVPHSELPAFLCYADIGIIPFNRRDFPTLVNAICPVKLYEYMACGLPVVASKWDEIEQIASPALLCSSYEEFLTALMNYQPLKERADTYIQFAKQNDWSKRFNALVKLISDVGP
ncbi:MAG TPA: glycosyltransferase [Anaerolineaceae bacterium]|jgi:glycosyltransferase involved in cell wall biosynthesis|nr:glycosyltransferase [Anaerolineaceae bacterium]HNS06586.1 glycosyltransferase [Anaerolineaceae bacterium]